MGGLIGAVPFSFATFDIGSNYATGNVNAPTGNYVGGLIGQVANSRFSIADVYATGNVVGAEAVGGLIGQSNSPSMARMSAKGSVQGTHKVGGLLGEFIPYTNMTSKIENCYSMASVQGLDTTDQSIGGLIGSIDGSAAGSQSSLEYCYFGGTVDPANTVSGTLYLGAAVGFDDRLTEYQSVYWDSSKNSSVADIGYDAVSTTTDFDSANISGVASSILTQSPNSTLVGDGWDFNDIWQTDTQSTNQGYPLLIKATDDN